MSFRYKGFSSFEYEDNKSFGLTDVELVKLDILNHLFTRRGERVGMPEYGTRIPDLLFEPLDEEILDLIQDEVQAVVDYDPRVELLELNAIPNYNANRVTVNVRVLYIELNMTEDIVLGLDFEEVS